MRITLLLVTTLLLASLPTLAQEPSREPLRNTFVTASETVIDTATAIDFHAAPASFDPQMLNLRAIKTNLDAMIDSEEEKLVARSLNDLIFLVSACHLQSVNATDTSKCEAQFSRARIRAMESIRRHKDGPNWLPGPPA